MRMKRASRRIWGIRRNLTKSVVLVCCLVSSPLRRLFDDLHRIKLSRLREGLFTAPTAPARSAGNRAIFVAAPGFFEGDVYLETQIDHLPGFQFQQRRDHFQIDLAAGELEKLVDDLNVLCRAFQFIATGSDAQAEI